MKQIITTILIALLLGTAIPVRADEDDVHNGQDDGHMELRTEVKVNLDARRATSTDVRKASSTLRMQIRAELEARKASSTLRRASSTEKRIENQQGLAKRKAEHTGKVLLATIERLEKILARIESRIAKVEASGGTATESKEAVAEAKASLSKAKVSLEAFSSIDLSGDKASENFARVRAVAAEVKSHIKEAHLSMMLAVRTLKPGRNSGNATSTSATSTSQ
jgi:hypothetical protein